MTPQLLLLVLFGFALLLFTLQEFADYLNLRAAQPQLPEEFKDVYDEERYKKSQHYLHDNTKIGSISSFFFFSLTWGFVFLGGFNAWDTWIRHFDLPPILQGLAFMGTLGLASQLLSLPFSIYQTFVIEKKYEFNTMTPLLFIKDILKGLLLGVVIGGPILALVLWFFEKSGPLAWAYVWISLTGIQLLLFFLAPILIMPLFNTFTPLPDGELKTAILDYAKKENFSLQGLFSMDGSKRSKKSNAFFTGFGKFKRIVLFDTLIEKHTVNELLAIVAHEMGHYKKKHIFKMLVLSIATSGAMFYFLSLVLNTSFLFDAFNVTPSTYMGLLLFAFLYSPVSFALGLLSTIMSRKHEYEADAYAITTTGYKDEMIHALKKLSSDNLANLTPHPLKVFLEYSHPPLRSRVRAIQAIK